MCEHQWQVRNVSNQGLLSRWRWCTLSLTYCSLSKSPCTIWSCLLCQHTEQINTDLHMFGVQYDLIPWKLDAQKGIYNYRSTPHQGYMERISRTTICWGWKNALATRRTSFRNWGGTSAVGKGLYITVLVSVLIKILLVSYSNCIWCEQFMMQ